MRHRPAVVFALLTALVAAVALVGCGADGDGPSASALPDSEVELLYVIPAGTGERLDAGESVDILPAELDVQVGDVIRLDNQDDRTHAVGPFSVRPGEVLSYRFPEATTITGRCSVHPSGQIRLVVTP